MDLSLFTFHAILWLQVLCYKIHLKSLVNLLQPCHLSLLFEGIALLLGDGPLSALMTIISLPITIGAVAALANPATEGLDFFLEKEAFFVQHYLLLVTPLYLLCRADFAVLRLFDFRALLCANFFSLALHWLFFVVSVSYD
jgi:hypothetical protein